MLNSIPNAKKLSLYCLMPALLFSYCAYPALATTYYVNPGQSIQTAIDGASYGDTVEVSAGTYVENITLKNGVALIGEVIGNEPNNTIIDGNDANSVVSSSNCDPNTVLEGFTITNGSAAYGGGMYNEDSSSTVTNCTFTDNWATEGGGMYNGGGSQTITNCTFIGNPVGGGGGYSRGGGMCNEGGSQTITNCTFIRNRAMGTESRGGGMYNSGSQTITNCTFIGNLVEGSDMSRGGGMYNSGGSPTVTNCTFSGNSTEDPYNGGGMFNNRSNPAVTNCILWGNEYEEIYNQLSTPLISYCDIRGGWPGEGNIDVDPLFFDPDGPDNILYTEDDDLRLLPGSPCIDAGNNGAVPVGITTDKSGNPRFFDDPNTSDTGIGTPPIVDMGAYEYAFAVNAVFTAVPNPAARGEDVAFDASASFCYDPRNSIVSYEWDFDYDGVTFDVDDTGVSTTYSYGFLGSYDVALRVTDDAVPANTDIEVVTVYVSVGNHAPSADAGGPYTVNQGECLLLDGSGSTPGGDDATYGDQVQLYEWDLDADGQFDDFVTADAVTTVAWSSLSLLSKPLGNQTISLRVTDNCGWTDTAATTLTITYHPLSWGTLTVDNNGDVGYHTSLALDSVGHPHISYFDYSNGDLKYAFWNGASWDIQTVDSSGDVGDYTSLALDSSGNPHISYYDYSNGDLKYASWNGTTWDIETVDSSGVVGSYTSLALDSSGNPHISYYDYSNRNLKYAWWNGTSWIKQTADNAGAGNVGRYTSLALDSSDYPSISYFDYLNYDLKYAWWNGSSWLKQTVDSVGNVGIYTSLALDSVGHPHISYFDYSNGDLKYAAWNGTSWIKQTADSIGNVGSYTSLALDSSDNPHISYYDYTNSDLKYASWNGADWDIQTVKSNVDVSYQPSLALDSSGNPLISYYDYSNLSLKLAVTCVSIPGDLNADCYVNILDFAEFANQWLDCSVPFDPDCAAN